MSKARIPSARRARRRAVTRHRRLAALAGLCAAGLGIAGPGAASPGATLPALPGIGADDSRVPVDMAVAPWRAVVRVQTEIGRRCTGVLIAPSVALTAAHCLLARDDRTRVPPRIVHVLSGYRMGRYDGHAHAIAATVPPGYDPARQAATAGSDWAVLVLDTKLGADGRALTLASALPALGAPVMLGGYDQDRAEVLTADRDCHVTGLLLLPNGRRLVRDDCNATRGVSGAPLIGRGPDGAYVVYGLQVMAPLHGAGGEAVPAAALAAGPVASRVAGTAPAGQD